MDEQHSSERPNVDSQFVETRDRRRKVARRSHWRLPQYSLRLIFIAMSVACVMFAVGSVWGVKATIGTGIAVLTMGFMLFAHRRGFENAALFIIGAIGIIFLLLIPAFQSPIVTTRQSTCAYHLRQVSLALRNYHDHYGSFPPAYIADDSGKPIHSWRVLILPYMEYLDIFQAYRFDEPWNGPNNSKLHTKRPRCFECSSSQPNKTSTNYFLVTGPGTMFPGDRTTTRADLTDGAERTIVLVEISNSGVNWLEPRDIDIRQLALLLRLLPAHTSGSNVAFADGSVKFLDNQTAATTLEAMATIAGGEKVEIPSR